LRRVISFSVETGNFVRLEELKSFEIVAASLVMLAGNSTQARNTAHSHPFESSGFLMDCNSPMDGNADN